MLCAAKPVSHFLRKNFVLLDVDAPVRPETMALIFQETGCSSLLDKSKKRLFTRLELRFRYVLEQRLSTPPRWRPLLRVPVELASASSSSHRQKKSGRRKAVMRSPASYSMNRVGEPVSTP